MKKLALALTLALTLCLTACTPLERQAYNTAIAAKAFLDSVKAAHPECPAASSTLCSDVVKATAAKDALIDALEVYCSGAAFESGGACQAPAKGTAALVQAEAKLRAALSHYSQTEKDLKGVL